MKFILVFILLIFTCNSFAQLNRTTVTDIGKIGKLHFQLAKDDTSCAVSISQKSMDIRIVVIQQKDINEVVQTLTSFVKETSAKADDKTVITYKMKDLLLSCSYFKQTGWMVMIQNTIPGIDENSEAIQRKTGYRVNSFVEIKPDQLAEVVKIMTKATESKAG